MASAFPPKSAVSPTPAPIIARASGAEKEMRPAWGSASSSPTISMLLRWPFSVKVTHDPKATSPSGRGRRELRGGKTRSPVAQIALSIGEDRLVTLPGDRRFELGNALLYLNQAPRGHQIWSWREGQFETRLLMLLVAFPAKGYAHGMLLVSGRHRAESRRTTNATNRI